MKTKPFVFRVWDRRNQIGDFIAAHPQWSRNRSRTYRSPASSHSKFTLIPEFEPLDFAGVHPTMGGKAQEDALSLIRSVYDICAGDAPTEADLTDEGTLRDGREPTSAFEPLRSRMTKHTLANPCQVKKKSSRMSKIRACAGEVNASGPLSTSRDSALSGGRVSGASAPHPFPPGTLRSQRRRTSWVRSSHDCLSRGTSSWAVTGPRRTRSFRCSCNPSSDSSPAREPRQGSSAHYD